jgi:AcrR family transcriptional regulator
VQEPKDPTATRPGDEAAVLTESEQERVLAAATTLFSKHGPRTLSLKWVALGSDVPSELVSARWPTIELLLAAVLARLSAQFEGLTGDSLSPHVVADENELIDTYHRIIARSLLDDVNPVVPDLDLLRNGRWIKAFQEQFGIDEPAARLRLSQTFALEWGWRLFGPHIKSAAGLGEEPDDSLIAEVRALEMQIIRMPPDDPT